MPASGLPAWCECKKWKLTIEDIPAHIRQSNPAIHRYTNDAFIEHLVTTLNRYESGDFTVEEIHNFCHKLPEIVSAKDFASGCMAYQTQLYGSSLLMNLLRDTNALLEDWGVSSNHATNGGSILRRRIQEQIL